MLVETLIAAALLLVGMAGILSLVDTASSTTRVTQTREAGTALQREIIEAARAIPYEQMTPNTLVQLLSSRPGLGDGQLGVPGWTVNRRGAVFTVSVGVCTVDDPRDGFGSHEAGVFCRRPTGASTEECSSWLSVTGSLISGGLGAGVGVTAGECGIDADLDGSVDGLAELTATLCVLGSCGTPLDTAPGDYKRVVSLVRWPGGWNLQTTTINSPGSAAAPAVATLTAAPSPVSSGSTVSLTATVAPTPTTVSFTVDGRQVTTGTATTPGTWTGLWDLGPVTTTPGAQPANGETLDGSRLVSAKAFDQYGQFGATRSAAVMVNRRRPFAPARIGAGRNGAAVEIEWSPAKELDIEGHRVYRSVSGTGRVEVCPLVRATRCRDSSPPSVPLLTYDVVAVDRDPLGNLREGDVSTGVSVTQTNRPPPAPTNLVATLGTSGVQLTWSAPTTPDPDFLTGDKVDHFNIYRDGTSVEDRIDLTDVSSTTWTDVSSGGIPHSYYVTAVDQHLAESPVLGPVTR